MEEIILQSHEESIAHLKAPLDETLKTKAYCYAHHSQYPRESFSCELVNGRYVSLLKRKGKKSALPVHFHSGFLESTPVTKTQWRLELLLLECILAISLYLSFSLSLNNIYSLLIASTLSLCLLTHYFLFRRTTYFCSRTANLPIIKINRRCKDSKECSRFIRKIQIAISDNPLPRTSEYSAEEVKWLRELKDTGWISEKNYQISRDIIFKSFGKKAS